MKYPGYITLGVSIIIAWTGGTLLDIITALVLAVAFFLIAILWEIERFNNRISVGVAVNPQSSWSTYGYKNKFNSKSDENDG